MAPVRTFNLEVAQQFADKRPAFTIRPNRVYVVIDSKFVVPLDAVDVDL